MTADADQRRSSTAREFALTLGFIVDAPLRLLFELGTDAVKQLIQALGGRRLIGSHRHAGRVAVIHGFSVGARRGGAKGILCMWAKGSAGR
jgi:hypothetical protein